MAEPSKPHVGMQTVTFTCAKGDQFIAHGHTEMGQHGHEIRRLCASLKKGCTALKMRPGTAKKIACGAPVTETTEDHVDGPLAAPVEQAPAEAQGIA